MIRKSTISSVRSSHAGSLASQHSNAQLQAKILEKKKEFENVSMNAVASRNTRNANMSMNAIPSLRVVEWTIKIETQDVG